MGESTRRAAFALGLLMMVSTFGLSVPPVRAGHWCTALTLSISPDSGAAASQQSFSITVRNGITDSLDIRAILVQFQWESNTWDWGTMNLQGGASDTNTFTKTMASTPGDYSVSITVRGQAVGDFLEGDCGFTATFTVLADTDGDGVPNASDNCVSVANQDQLDADADGQGDACDSSRAGPGGDLLVPIIGILIVIVLVVVLVVALSRKRSGGPPQTPPPYQPPYQPPPYQPPPQQPPYQGPPGGTRP